MFRLYTAKKMKNCCCYSVAGDLTSVFTPKAQMLQVLKHFECSSILT